MISFHFCGHFWSNIKQFGSDPFYLASHLIVFSLLFYILFFAKGTKKSLRFIL